MAENLFADLEPTLLGSVAGSDPERDEKDGLSMATQSIAAGGYLDILIFVSSNVRIFGAEETTDEQVPVPETPQNPEAPKAPSTEK
jgi:hypothetical protein